MTDGQWLFAVFATLYLLECLRWAPLADGFLMEKKTGHWRHVRPSKMISARGLGLVFLRPLPPFRAHLIVSSWRFVPEEDRLVCLDDEGPPSFIPWAELRSRTEGVRVILPGGSAVRLATAANAIEWSHRLNEWAALPAKDRELAFLELAARSLDPEIMKKRVGLLSQRVRSLNANAALILLWCFGVITGVYSWFGESAILWSSLLILLALQALQCRLFWRATRPDAEVPVVSYRFWKALSIAFMPQFSIRAGDHLCAAETHSGHPLSARDLLREREYLTLAENFWRQARYTRGWTTREVLPIRAEALAQHFRKVGMPVSAFEEPPPRETESRSYCPRCLTQFQLEKGECSDCQGTDLSAFK